MRVKIAGLNDWGVIRVEDRGPAEAPDLVATVRRKHPASGGPRLSFRVPPDWYQAYVEALSSNVIPVPPVGEELEVVAAWIE